MLPLLLLAFTAPLAIAGINYRYEEDFFLDENSGVYCCGITKNLIINGNFEHGNANFDTSYTYSSRLLPGQYEVTNYESNSVLTVLDHSSCRDSNYHKKNSKVLLVHGLTNQPAGSTSVIWHQKIDNLKTGKWYRFCANFKNLQIDRDILPVVTVELSTGFSRTVTIDTDVNDPCHWQQMSFCFYVGSRVSVKIMIEESSEDDGNALAIDDVSVQEFGDPWLFMIVLPFSVDDPNEVRGIMDTSSVADGPEECRGPYYWFVVTLQSHSGGTFTVNWSAPRGWGNSTGSFRANRYAEGPPWGPDPISGQIDTLFPGFVFLPNTVYAIGVVTPPCCETCIANGWTYHVIYPSFFRRENWPNGEDTYTSNYGLTEMDRFYVEQWVGTYEP